MKISEICIENFLTIGTINARLGDKGLVLIQGQNLDDSSQESNGSGKSSFPDALSWCLFGETARGQSGDAVVNETMGKQCRVVVTIEDGTQRYEIARHRKHDSGKNRLTILRHNGTGFDVLTKGTDKLTQPLVDQIVGCSVDVFNSAIYMGQERMPDLPGMTDKFLKSLVEEAAGISEVQKGYQIALDRVNETRLALKDRQWEFDRVGRMQDMSADHIRSILDSRQKWDEAKAKKLDDAAGEAQKIREKLPDAIAAVEKAEAEIATLTAARNQLTDRIHGLAKEQATMDALKEVETERRGHKATFSREVQRCEEILQSVESELAQVDSLVGKPCRECGKPHSEDDLATTRAMRERAKQEAKQALEQVQSSLNESCLALGEASAEVQQWTQQMTDVSESVAKRDKIDRAIRQRESAIKELDDMSEAIKMIESHMAHWQSETCPHKEGLDEAYEKHKALQTERDSLDSALALSESELTIRTMVARVMSPSGVRAHILDLVTPFLNQRTSGYLAELTDGNISAIWSTISLTAKGEARERFAIDVQSKCGAKSFKGLSGGEKRKVRLACSMALQDLVASRATKPIDLYIADEIDDALDDSGLERLMGILDRKARERGTVLVISHNELGDWIRDSVVITKQNGVSTMDGLGALS